VINRTGAERAIEKGPGEDRGDRDCPGPNVNGISKPTPYASGTNKRARALGEKKWGR